VAEPGDAVHPGCLFADLTDDEGLEQVSELGERRWITTGETIGRHA